MNVNSQPIKWEKIFACFAINKKNSRHLIMKIEWAGFSEDEIQMVNRQM